MEALGVSEPGMGRGARGAGVRAMEARGKMRIASSCAAYCVFAVLAFSPGKPPYYVIRWGAPAGLSTTAPMQQAQQLAVHHIDHRSSTCCR
eukprot:scaffold1151_cov126-Isochrysis_galbana.AAC.23